jgi:hypothetical protein
MYIGLHVTDLIFLSYCNQIELRLGQQIFKKFLYTKFNQNPCSGNRFLSCIETDGLKDSQADRQANIKVKVAFCNFANAPKILGNTLNGQNARFLIVKNCGTSSNHWNIKG